MKVTKNQFVKYLLSTSLFIIASIFLILFIKSKDELNQIKIDYRETTKSFNKEKHELTSEINKLKSQVPKSENISSNSIFVYGNDIDDMKKQGLANPVSDIISDLQKHRELIPYKGVLGGTMGFYSRKDVLVLTDKWVLAEFDDGHIAGYILLEYHIENGGKIDWKKIAVMRG